MKLPFTSALAFASSLLIGSSTAAKITFDASFDDLVLVPVEPLVNNVGIYRNISFINFNTVQSGVAGESVDGVLPHSNPNQAGLFVQPGNLTTQYPGSTIRSLALNSYYYGCATAGFNNVADAAVPCNITATGYKAGSANVAANQTFEFVPAEPVDLQNAPTFGTFEGTFQGLQNVSFAFEPAGTAVLLIDDLVGSVQT